MIRIVTAYTPDYAGLAGRLIESAQAFGVPISPVAFESRGSWAANNNFKPTAILSVMQETGDDCLWLDADMYLRDWPQKWPDGDVLLKFSDPPEAQVFDFKLMQNVPNSGSELTPWGGHCLFRNNEMTRGLLALWKRTCDAHTITNDEQCLRHALNLMDSGVTIGPLIPDFIVHTPAGAAHGKPSMADGWL
jgi:hypothetical protein